MAIVVLFVTSLIVLHSFYQYKKYIAIGVLVLSVVIAASAFDVGTRQADLGRNKFDVETPVSTVDKVEAKHNTAASIKTKFDETTLKLKETK
jgi:hypothetical protein